MGKAEKILAGMKANPLDWRIDSLKVVAREYGLEWRQPGTSHVAFRHPNGQKITVPAHKPVKPVYIRKFIKLIEHGKGD